MKRMTAVYEMFLIREGKRKKIGERPTSREAEEVMERLKKKPENKGVKFDLRKVMREAQEPRVQERFMNKLNRGW